MDTPYTIADLRKNRALLEREVARNSKQINQRFYRIEKNKRFTSEKSWAYRRAIKISNKEKPRFTQTITSLKKLSTSDLISQFLEVNSLLDSDTSSVQGLKLIQKKSYATLNERLFDEGKINTPISNKELDNFFNNTDESLFSDYGSNELINHFTNYVQNGKVTTEQFFKEFRDYQEKTDTDVFDVLDKLDALNKVEE